MAQTLRIERQLGDWMRARLPRRAAGFVMFVLKQGWAALCGGLFLIAIIGAAAVWQDDWALARYDALFLITGGALVKLVFRDALYPSPLAKPSLRPEPETAGS